MKSIFETIVLTFRSRKHAVIAIISFVVMTVLAVLIPSFLTPSNTVALQLSLLQTTDIALILLFSALFGISIAMQTYASHREKIKNSKLGLKGTGTGFVALVGTLFSAKLCPICLGVILGFVGVGGSASLFLFSYKNWILIASIFILVFTIYLAGRRITKVNVCENCK
jgi:hypothetical protein